MRILWLTPYPPLPTFGGGTRVFNLIKALSARCEIDLIAAAEAPGQSETVLDPLRAFCRSVALAPPAVASRRHRRLLQLRSLCSRRPSQYWTAYSPRMQARVDRALRKRSYDVVVVEHSFAGYYVLGRTGHIPVVLDQHNVESEILRRSGRSERSLLRRAFNGLEWLKFRSDERRICRAASLILATSEPDCAVMEGWGGLPPCAVVPNGVDTRYFAPPEQAPGESRPPGLVFSASMHYAPNVEAMLYFTSEIWPHIQAQAPGVTLTIVGGSPPPEIVRLMQYPDIRLEGYVPDLRPYISGADVVVVPLRIGGGTRLKILEALAMGQAVVSTSLGCEGLEVQDGRHLLVADEPRAFATRVVELLCDPPRRAALGAEGRRLVETEYDWSIAGRRMKEALRAVLAGTGRPAEPGTGREAQQAPGARVEGKGAMSAQVRESDLRVALLPWMVAGVRTQYENLRLAPVPAGMVADTLPIVPYEEGGLIERLPMLRASQKGTLRSTAHALPLLSRPDYDAVWSQVVLPLVPLLLASDAGLKRLPAIVYTIDTTPTLMDGFSRIYYDRPPAHGLKRGLRDLLHRYVLQRCAAVTPWSHWAARSFVRDYGVPEERIHVIPPGVDLNAWSVPAHRRNGGTADTTGQPFRLLFVGADFERKGGPLLLDVFRRHLRDTCELHLVTRADVPDEHGVRVYRGFEPNEPGLRGLYESCDALVLPTRADCFSLASIEAMACGLPVISCPVGGIPEIVRHGETGFLVPPDDGNALLHAIQRLMDDPARARQMGLEGRDVVEERFNNSRNSALLFTLLCRLAS